MFIIRRNPIAFMTLLLAAALAFGIIVWWLINSASNPDGEAIAANVCSASAHTTNVDVVISFMTPDGSSRQRIEIEYGDSGIKHTAYDNSRITEEFITILSTPTPTPPAGASGSEGDQGSISQDEQSGARAIKRLDYDHAIATYYYNEKPGRSGRGASWSISTREVSLEESGSAFEHFCGRATSTFHSGPSFTRSETIRGMRTRRYTGSVEADNNPGRISEGDETWTFWVDYNGRLVRLEIYDKDTKWTTRADWSNWNQNNNISAPIIYPASNFASREQASRPTALK